MCPRPPGPCGCRAGEQPLRARQAGEAGQSPRGAAPAPTPPTNRDTSSPAKFPADGRAASEVINRRSDPHPSLTSPRPGGCPPPRERRVPADDGAARPAASPRRSLRPRPPRKFPDVSADPARCRGSPGPGRAGPPPLLPGSPCLPPAQPGLGSTAARRREERAAAEKVRSAS